MLIEDLIDHKFRLKEGIFFTKPVVVEEIIKNFNYKNIDSVLDSAAGSCNFLIPLAKKFPHINFYGIEKNEVIYNEVCKRISSIKNLHYFHGDMLLDKFPIPKCDLYLGNPPFINYSDLDKVYREKIRPLWLKHFPEAKGFKMLLGDSRGDISQLIFYETLEKYLKPTGKFGVILPNSLIKGNSASAGFREFCNIEVKKIVDIGDKNPFDNTKRNCFYILGNKGSSTQYPIQYYSKNNVYNLIKSGGDLINEGKSIIKTSPYTARQGVNTLGANSVFFFKKELPFKSQLFKPLLKSSDIHPFKCTPSYYILFPYINGDLIDEGTLKNDYAEAYNYLLKHKNKLESRKSRFAKKSWYTLFGVGNYTFEKYKVIWRGLGAKELMASVTSDVIPNQSMNCYISVSDKNEAYYICGIMNSKLYKDQLSLLNESGVKSFAQPNTINRLYIPLFNQNNSIHNQICSISKTLHSSVGTSSIDILNNLIESLYNNEGLWTT